MKTVKSLLAAAMEGLEDGDAPTEIVSYDVSAHDAAVTEVEEAHRGVEESLTDIETIDESAAGLESLIATLESLDAPLTATSATFMNIAAESHMLRVGLDMSDSPLIASFENDGETATRLSVDNIKAKIKAIWDAIKKAVINAYQSFMSFLKTAFDANEHLEKRAKTLLANAKHIGQAKARTEEIEDAGLAKKLHTAGATSDLVGQFADAVYFIEGVNEAVSHEATPEQIMLQTQVHMSGAKSAEDLDKAFMRLKQLKMAPTKAFPTASKTEKGHEHRSKDLPGGVYFVFITGEGNDAADGLTYAKQFIEGYQIQERQSEVKGEIAGKLPVLGAAAIQTICAGAIEIAQRNKTLNAAGKDAEKNFLEISRSVEESKAEEGLPSDQVARINEFHRLIGRGATLGLKRIGVILKYNTRVGRDFLAYAEKSFAQYDVAKPAAEPEKKDEPAQATA